jgi:uncharacterized Zn finger protein (UPF0148 family)
MVTPFDIRPVMFCPECGFVLTEEIITGKHWCIRCRKYAQDPVQPREMTKTEREGHQRSIQKMITKRNAY